MTSQSLCMVHLMVRCVSLHITLCSTNLHYGRSLPSKNRSAICTPVPWPGVLERIAEQSQVIITTHSSQLLDAFDPENLSDSLGILLLRNRPGQGTEVINFEDIRSDRESLNGWIADFGIGSGIFESGLLQDLMEEPACQA